MTLRILTGISLAVAAGFALSYVITMGNLFSYLVRNGKEDFFGNTYAIFRKNSRAKYLYGIFLPGLPAIFGILSLFDKASGTRLPLIAAIMIFPVYYTLLHRPTKFAMIEERLNSGKALSVEEKKLYIRYNLPLHITLGLLYLISSLMIFFL